MSTKKKNKFQQLFETFKQSTRNTYIRRLYIRRLYEKLMNTIYTHNYYVDKYSTVLNGQIKKIDFVNDPIKIKYEFHYDCEKNNIQCNKRARQIEYYYKQILELISKYDTAIQQVTNDKHIIINNMTFYLPGNNKKEKEFTLKIFR